MKRNEEESAFVILKSTPYNINFIVYTSRILIRFYKIQMN